MSALYEHYPMEMWTVDGIFWIVGIFFWFVTYIGAPLESKKTGRNVSGIPGTAFIAFLIAGLLSPFKWLALLCLLDFSILWLFISCFYNDTKTKLDKNHNQNHIENIENIENNLKN